MDAEHGAASPTRTEDERAPNKTPSAIDEKRSGVGAENGPRETTSDTSRSDNDAEHDLEKGAAEAALATSMSTTAASEALSANPTTEENANETPNAALQDPDVVHWIPNADQDPENPMNWTTRMKWINLTVLSINTFITPLASSMFAPGVPDVMRDFRSKNQELATFVVSVYILGFATGPLFIAPLSEMYGRVHLYNVSNVFFVVFTAACALATNMNMLIGFRFLAGCVGATPVTIGGGTIADVIPVQERGRAMAIWAMGPLLGPVVGPVAGGYLIEAKGWRWVFWLLCILSSAITIATFVVARETFAPVVLERKTARLRKETGNERLRSALASPLTHKERLARAVVRPSKMLVRSPIVAGMSMYIAIVYAILYILFTTFTFVFQGQYGFSSGTTGLTFIPIGVGMFVGLAAVGVLSDRYIKAAMASPSGATPEHRLPSILTTPPGLLIVFGLIIYGWTADKRTHWIAPMIGTACVGAGMIGVMMTTQTYMIDAFTQHAASAIAANTVLRSVVGALLPLAGLRMYDVMGLGWGNTFLAFLALVMVPIPAFFSKYGARLREKYFVEF